MLSVMSLASTYRKAVPRTCQREYAVSAIGMISDARYQCYNAFFPLSLTLQTNRVKQGTLAEGEGSVQLTSSLR
jgi:hypothetical protein